MAVPTTRKEFSEYCLRTLGKPVIEINVDPDQVEDRIDEALKYYYDYHFDGAEKIYYKWQVTDQYFPGRISELIITNGGTGYANGETLTLTGFHESNADISVITNANGTITDFNIVDRGKGYKNEPTVTVNTSNGSGAKITALNGGYIPMPENVIGAVNIFEIGQSLNTNNLFNIRYQIALNDLYTLTSVSMVPYYMAMQHVQFLEQMLVGKQPLRYNRNANRLYVDMYWSIVNPGDYVIVEVYQVVDPEVYTRAWGERWLQRYATCLIKQQWGRNLTKFSGMKLAGGIMFNGEKILNDATQERAELEKEMIYTYSLPALDMIG